MLDTFPGLVLSPTPYPRERPASVDRMSLVDRLVALLVAVYVIVAFVDVLMAGPSQGVAINIAIGLVPAILLLIPRVASMLAVTLLSVPCCLGASWYADLAQIPDLADHMLYDGCWFMLIVGLYAFLRTAQLYSRRKQRSLP